MFKLGDRVQIRFGEPLHHFFAPPPPLSANCWLFFVQRHEWLTTILFWNAADDKKWYGGEVVKSLAKEVKINFDGESRAGLSFPDMPPRKSVFLICWQPPRRRGLLIVPCSDGMGCSACFGAG